MLTGPTFTGIIERPNFPRQSTIGGGRPTGYLINFESRRRTMVGKNEFLYVYSFTLRVFFFQGSCYFWKRTTTYRRTSCTFWGKLMRKRRETTKIVILFAWALT